MCENYLSMDSKEVDTFKVLKECARNIDQKVKQVEMELLTPALFGDPLKSVASEEFVNQRVEEVVDIKEHLKKLIEETIHSIDAQKKFNEQMSKTKNAMLQQLTETESHLQKYGYKPEQENIADLLPHEREESCGDSEINMNEISISDEDMVTQDFDDKSLSYKECLTPLIAVEQSRSSSKASSNKQCLPRKLVENEASESKSNSLQTLLSDDINETPGYSEHFYALERKYKMYKQNQLQKGHE